MLYLVFRPRRFLLSPSFHVLKPSSHSRIENGKNCQSPLISVEYQLISITTLCNPFTCPLPHSVSHLVAANEASAGVWTSMAFSSPAQTTVEGTFSVKTWRAATTTSEKGRNTDPYSPPPNHHVTQGPRLLSESHLYASPSVHFKIFVFSNRKKRREKNPNERTG